MPDAFNPYHKWLGIPLKEQPADHYQLLAIARFESDADVIEGAADRQMAHVRTFQAGQHSALSQRILNELSAARLCLLNPQKKAAYDGELRRRIDAAQSIRQTFPTARPLSAAPTLTASVIPVQDESPTLIVTDHGPAPRSAGKRRSKARGPLAAWAAVGLTVVVASVVVSMVVQLNNPKPATKTGRPASPIQQANAPAPKTPGMTPPKQSERSGGDGEASHQRPVPQVAQVNGGLKILEARWGSGQNWVDATATVQAGVRDGRYLATAVTTALSGRDPAQGYRKQLVIRYSIGGQTRTDKFDEDQVVYLAADDPPSVQRPGLTLLEAKYGGGNVWVDVLDRLKPMVKDNSLSVRANLATSIDPLPGAAKALFVRYTLNGKSGHASALNRDQLRIGAPQIPADAATALAGEEPPRAVSPSAQSLAATAAAPAGEDSAKQGGKLASSTPEPKEAMKSAEPTPKPPSLSDLVKEKDTTKLTAKEVASLKQHTAAVTRIVFHRTRPVLASAGKDGRVLLWNLETRAWQGELAKFPEEVWAIKFRPDGGLLALANRNWWGSRLLFKTVEGVQLHEIKDFKRGGGEVTSIAYSHDGRLFAAGQADGTIRLWDVAQFSEIAPVAFGLESRIYALAFGPKTEDRKSRRAEYLLAAGGQDGELKTLAVTYGKSKAGDQCTFQQTTVPFAKADVVLGVRFSPDGKLLGCARRGGRASLYNPRTGESVRELSAAGGTVEWIAFHPQRPWCVTAHNNEHLARIWNKESGELLCELKGHTGGVMCAEFSPDGRYIATASEDFSIKLWDLAGPDLPAPAKGSKKVKSAALAVGD